MVGDERALTVWLLGEIDPAVDTVVVGAAVVVLGGGALVLVAGPEFRAVDVGSAGAVAIRGRRRGDGVVSTPMATARTRPAPANSHERAAFSTRRPVAR